MKKKLKKKLKSLLMYPFAHSSFEHKPDFVLIITLGVLTFVGLLLLSSASSVQAFQKFNDSYYFLKNQVIRGLIPGIIAFFIVSRIDFRKWKGLAFWMLIGSIALLILVFIPGIGVSYGKAQSWISVFGFSFQPTEIVKLTFLIYLATWLAKKDEHQIKDFEYSFLPFLFVLGVIVFLILAQPDLGTLIVILAISFMVYFAAGAPWKHILALVGGGVIILFIAIQIAPYRLDRITAFFNPGIDPQGSSYHITQAKLAIGSGGMFGMGMGKSRQKFNYLPEVSGDSIFAVIAEEMGFFFAVAILLSFLTIMIRGFKIARGSPDNFGKLLAIGITSWISFQAFVNIAAMVGLLPLTGIPLPFISYGGTALTILLLASGILVNISKQTKN
ncbi:putative lipid II flippase FtsW [bacterium]|jgi:cell division protein FtsW|nr:putative lipid II flippase FtsW [bacterium]MBT4495373.1 putative lipid II flippase FtsW [bacterium]MBT4764102.1 putative lipid II flippase FtsW [bacterium]MBT5401474.1 putative lipid II flippase FtsW [bacterium]MBT5942567.1 putative lipid II flippase FtsW [bacterium]